MPSATITTEVMRQLPPTLRPNPNNIHPALQQLKANGWTAHQIVARVKHDGDTTAGHVVTTIRSLTHIPAPSTTHTNGLDLGTCQQGCNHGWISDSPATPCPSCRPDTTRRLALREEARRRGASLTTRGDIMTNHGRKLDPVPRTTPNNGR